MTCVFVLIEFLIFNKKTTQKKWKKMNLKLKKKWAFLPKIRVFLKLFWQSIDAILQDVSVDEQID